MQIIVKQPYQSSWILNEDGEFECAHDDSRVETFEVDTMRNGEHDTYEQQGYVCADPDCEAELDGDPAADRADALADAQIMEALGK